MPDVYLHDVPPHSGEIAMYNEVSSAGRSTGDLKIRDERYANELQEKTAAGALPIRLPLKAQQIFPVARFVWLKVKLSGG